MVLRRALKNTAVLAWVALSVLPISASAAGLPVEPLLDKGFRQMYNLDFAGAHATFAEYEHANPENAMGPISDAAAYLFTEFDRLNILRSEYWIKDESFWVVN